MPSKVIAEPGWPGQVVRALAEGQRGVVAVLASPIASSRICSRAPSAEDDLVDQLFNAYNGRIRINQSLLSVVLHD